jgi:hypothetical protein
MPFDSPPAIGSLLLLGLLPILLLGLAIPYAVLALRDNQEVERDSQVGWKSALYFIFSVCVLQVLLGLTILVMDLMMESREQPFQVVPEPDFRPGFPGGQVQPRRQPVEVKRREMSATQRNAVGLMLAGALFGGAHLLLINLATNARRFPGARRIFIGARLGVHSLVVLGALTLLVVQLMDLEHTKVESLKPAFSILLVWTPSWVIHLALLRSVTTEPRTRRSVIPSLPSD